MHCVIDQETGQLFSLAYAKDHLVRDVLKANKPRMDSGMVQMSFCNPETGKCIYRENHTDPKNIFSSGVVVDLDNNGVAAEHIPGVDHVNPELVKAGDYVQLPHKVDEVDEDE